MITPEQIHAHIAKWREEPDGVAFEINGRWDQQVAFKSYAILTDSHVQFVHHPMGGESWRLIRQIVMPFAAVLTMVPEKQNLTSRKVIKLIQHGDHIFTKQSVMKLANPEPNMRLKEQLQRLSDLWRLGYSDEEIFLVMARLVQGHADPFGALKQSRNDMLFELELLVPGSVVPFKANRTLLDDEGSGLPD